MVQIWERDRQQLVWNLARLVTGFYGRISTVGHSSGRPSSQHRHAREICFKCKCFEFLTLKIPKFVIGFSHKYIPTVTTIAGLNKKLFTEIYADFSKCKYQ